MYYESIQVAQTAGMLTVTLARPESQNSITAALLADLHRALDLAERAPDCRIVVLQGMDGVFCTGMDLAEAANGTAPATRPVEQGAVEFFATLKRFSTIGRIIVSNVDGKVAGGGVGLVAASDIVYATERSQFSLPEALWGLLPCCVLPFLIRRVGFQRAYAMTLSTQAVNAATAAKFNLVDDVVAAGEPALRRLLMRASRLDPVTIGDLKRYAGQLWSISEETETVAVREFGRLMSTPAVRRRIEDFAIGQKFPWEN